MKPPGVLASLSRLRSGRTRISSTVSSGPRRLARLAMPRSSSRVGLPPHKRHRRQAETCDPSMHVSEVLYEEKSLASRRAEPGVAAGSLDVGAGKGNEDPIIAGGTKRRSGPCLRHGVQPSQIRANPVTPEHA